DGNEMTLGDQGLDGGNRPGDLVLDRNGGVLVMGGLPADVDDRGPPLPVLPGHTQGRVDAVGDRVLVPGVGRHVDHTHDVRHAAEGEIGSAEWEGHLREIRTGAGRSTRPTPRSTATSPSRSVRSTSVPLVSSVSITHRAGWPKAFGPTEITA